MLGCAGEESLGNEIVGFGVVVGVAVDGPEVPDDPGVFGDVKGFVGVVLSWGVAEMVEVRRLVVEEMGKGFGWTYGMPPRIVTVRQRRTSWTVAVI